MGLTVSTAQSNHEGDLIEHLHHAMDRYGGVALNPGAFAHYSYAIHDAIKAIALPVVEVHISDLSRREKWRQKSVIAPACVATVTGQGVDGYRGALEILAGRA